MRPVNSRRAIVEYARVLRLPAPGPNPPIFSPFSQDITDRLREQPLPTGHWRGRVWRMGNLEFQVQDSKPVSITGQFGWIAQETTSLAPPPYDETTQTWSNERTEAREGALAYFVIDLESQYMIITSLAGDVSMPAFSGALQDLLNRSEMNASRFDSSRALRNWAVTRVIEFESFEDWFSEMTVVTRIRASFHLPNPSTRPEIEPIVKMLHDSFGETGNLEIAGRDGIDPFKNETVKGAVVMSESGYGTLTADGRNENHIENKFISSQHPERQVLRLSDDEQFGMREFFEVMMLALSQLISQRRSRGTRE